LEETKEKGQESDFSQKIIDSGLVNATKLIAIPKDAMQIQIRLENLDDFLSNSETTRTVDL